MPQQVVCITGGYGKLGLAFASAFIQAGDEVIITGRDESKLKQAANNLKCQFHQTDVTDSSDLTALKEFIEAKHHRLDVLINNAAYFTRGYVADLDPDGFLQALKTNLYGPFLCTKMLLPLLRKSDNPLILNISSTSGHRADPGSSAYNASKFGLMGFTEALRKELRKENIRVTSMSPSAIFFGDDNDRGQGARLNGTDIAEAAVFLAKSKGRALFRDIEMWATNP